MLWQKKKKLFPAIYRSIAHKINTLALLALVSARLVEAENGLTPLPSLRSKAHKVIREILPYIWARFTFKLDHANFLSRIICLPTTAQ